MSIRIFAAGLVFAGAAFLSACQSGGAPAGSGPAGATGDAVRESELRAFCPPITILEGTASFRTYEGNAMGDPDRIVYQASIDETSRACDFGRSTVTAAAAGRVVPGPRGRPGSLNLPIRVVAMRGEEVVYSQMFSHPVTVSDTSGATQFIFSDRDIAIPGGIDRGVRLLIGFDEGTGR